MDPSDPCVIRVRDQFFVIASYVKDDKVAASVQILWCDFSGVHLG